MWSRLPIANATFGVCVSVTESVVSVAVYVTVSAVVSVTVKVTTPAASDGPLAAEIDEEPVWASETVLPATRVPEGVRQRDGDRRGGGAVGRQPSSGSRRPSTPWR